MIHYLLLTDVLELLGNVPCLVGLTEETERIRKTKILHKKRQESKEEE